MLRSLMKKIKNISRERARRNDIWTHFLFPLRQWHLYSEFENGKPAGGRIDEVMCLVIAVFMMLIALSISELNAESEQCREMGIGKLPERADVY